MIAYSCILKKQYSYCRIFPIAGIKLSLLFVPSAIVETSPLPSGCHRNGGRTFGSAGGTRSGENQYCPSQDGKAVGMEEVRKLLDALWRDLENRQEIAETRTSLHEMIARIELEPGSTQVTIHYAVPVASAFSADATGVSWRPHGELVISPLYRVPCPSKPRRTAREPERGSGRRC